MLGLALVAVLLQVTVQASLQEDYSSSYSYTDDWGKISPFCNGKRQSPINIDTSITLPALWVQTLLEPTTTEGLTQNQTLEHWTHTVEIDVTTDPGGLSGGILGNAQVTLEQFHWHSPSEHTLNGRHFPLEVHYFFWSEETQQEVVVAYFYDFGEKNQLIELVLEKLKGLPEGGKAQVCCLHFLWRFFISFWLVGGYGRVRFE